MVLWEADGGKEVRRLTSSKLGVNALAFAPDGKLLASGDAEGRLCLWDASTGGEICRTGGYQSGLHTEILSLAFAPKGRGLAAGYYNGTVRAWTLPASAQLLRAPADTASWLDKDVGQEHGHWEVVSSVAVAPDGKTVATAGGDGTVRLWDRTSGKEVLRVDGHVGRADCVAFSPDGKLLASSGAEDKVCVWALPAGKLLRRFQGYQVAFSPDGKFLASTVATEGRQWGAGYRDIVLQESGTGKELKRLVGHPGNVLCLAFSPDGRTLATGGVKQRTTGPNVDQAAKVVNTIRLWDLATAEERLQFGGDKFSVQSLAFSPDGRTLASGMWMSDIYKEGGKPDAPVQLWETATGKERGRLDGHSGDVSSVAFSRDGQTVAAGGRDRTVRVWDLATAKQVRCLLGHRASVTAVAFTPDDRALISGSQDTTALVWSLVPAVPPLRPPAEALAQRELDNLWIDLGGTDATRADRAVWTLAGDPARSVPFLRDRIRPVRDESERAGRLITDLDDTDFAVREKATHALKELGEGTTPALLKALKGSPSPEVRRRIEQLLKNQEALSARTARSLEVLERTGSAEARTLFEAIGRGIEGAPLTEEVRAVLKRQREHR